jgi:hypothetical protein
MVVPTCQPSYAEGGEVWAALVIKVPGQPRQKNLQDII